MNKQAIAMVTIAVFILGSAGCVSIPEEHKGAGQGAGIGAATGALAGAVLAGEGSRMQGAILGGLAGALVGGVIGNYTIDQKKNAVETSSEYNYQPSMGTMVRIESTSSSPYTVNPGGKVDLLTTYAVLGQNSVAPIAVTESHEIRHNNELVGKPTVNVSHNAGTYSSSIPLYLPSNAPAGSYQVLTTISTAAGSDSRETSFVVR